MLKALYDIYIKIYYFTNCKYSTDLYIPINSKTCGYSSHALTNSHFEVRVIVLSPIKIYHELIENEKLSLLL